MSKQSHTMSLVESGVNIVVGYSLNFFLNLYLFQWLLGVTIPVRENLIMGAIFTVVSLVRSFGLRRVFEHLRVRHHVTLSSSL